MSHKVFVFSHNLDSRPYAAQAFGREALKGDFLGEAVEIDSAISFGITACGQGVIGARSIVAGALGRLRTYKHAAGILHALGEALGIGGVDDKMLGRIFVGKPHYLIVVAKHYHMAVAERTQHHLAARQTV